MSMLRKASVPVNDNEKGLVLHSSSFRVSQPISQSPAATMPTAGFELDFLDSLSRHWLLSILVFGFIISVGSLWAIKTMRPIYQAETTIYIPVDLAKGSTDGPPDAAYPTFVNQQIMTILHYDTLSQALQQMQKKGIVWKEWPETERQAVERLRSSLDVQRVPDSYEVVIQMSSNNPRTSAEVANIIAASYLKEANRRDSSGRLDRGASLAQERAGLEKTLQVQLDLRTKLAQSLQVVNLHKSTTLPDDEVISQMRQTLAAARSKRIEAEEQLAAGQSTVSTDAEQIASADPAVRTVTSNLLQRQFELRERIKSMLPTHPVRIQAEAELAAIDAELQKGPGDKIPKITAQLTAKLEAQVEQSRRVEADMTREINQETSNIPVLARSLGQAEIVNGDIARIQDQLNRVEGQIEALSVRTSSGDVMRVFSQAQPPSLPLKSQRMKALGVTFALGLFFALAVPVAIDLKDSRIYDPATIERILGFPVVGMTIERNPKTELFAEEHLRRLVAGLERGIAGGAKTILLTGLKQQVPPGIVRDIARLLADRKINVTMRVGRKRFESDLHATQNQTRIINPGSLISSDVEDRNVVLMDAPALVFSAEAERMAAEADMTLVIVQAGSNTRPDLVRGARLLERLNVPAVGVILQNVRVERAGRSLRLDLKEYMALQRQLAPINRDWDGKAYV